MTKDAARQKVKYQEYKNKRRILLAKFNYECYLCEEQFSERLLQFHHLEYHTEESHHDRSCSNQWARWQRVLEVERKPERFRLLCTPCHNMITRLQRGRQVRWDRVPECIGTYTRKEDK